MQNQSAEKFTPRIALVVMFVVYNISNAIITLCLVRNSIQISKPKHPVGVRLDSFEKPYKQPELVSRRDIQTLENNGQKHSRFAFVYSPLFLVFGYPGDTLALAAHILLNS